MSDLGSQLRGRGEEERHTDQLGGYCVVVVQERKGKMCVAPRMCDFLLQASLGLFHVKKIKCSKI